jgi:hypothetical protein
VAVAANYHATRAATPLHPEHRIHDAEHAACYVPVREQAWRGHRLVPAVSSWDPQWRLFASAQGQLLGQGLEVEAWIVLTHNSTLGRAHPDLVVRNAFGDVYPYALCPAAPDVQEYCLTLVEEVLRSAPMDGVVLEAWGAMGIDHAGKHEKTEFAEWDEVAAEVATIRTGIARQLRELLVARCRSVDPSIRITVHGSSDPWATGSFATVQPAVGEGVDAVVASCWDPPAGSRRIKDLRALAAQAPRWAPTSGWTVGGPRTRRPISASRIT